MFGSFSVSSLGPVCKKMKQIILESATLIIACIIGMFAFRSLNTFHRIIFLQAIVAFGFYVASYVITEYQRSHNALKNNQWMFNVYILTEAILLLSAGYVYFSSKRTRFLLHGGFALFLVVFGRQVFFGDSDMSLSMRQFANQAAMFEGILVVTVYLLILRHCFLQPGFRWRTSPEFWLCLGLTIYFGCNIPYMGMIHSLHAYSSHLNELLFHFITDVLGNVRYLFLSIAFFLLYRRSSLSAL
jgi:hypothetical protein